MRYTTLDHEAEQRRRENLAQFKRDRQRRSERDERIEHVLNIISALILAALGFVALFWMKSTGRL